MFVLRQINSKINTTFVSMSVICIMLLITIGTLSTGMGIADVLSKSMKSSTPYDISFSYQYKQGDNKTQIKDIAKKMVADKINLSQYAKEYAQLNYYVSDFKYGNFHFDESLLRQNFGGDMIKWYNQQPIPVVSLTDYNKAAKMQGKAEITLKENEFAVNCTLYQFQPAIESFLQNNGKIEINGEQLICAEKFLPDCLANFYVGKRFRNIDCSGQYGKGSGTGV